MGKTLFVFSETGLLRAYFSPGLCSTNLGQADWKKCSDASGLAAGGSGLGQEVCLCLEKEVCPRLELRHVCAWARGAPVP